VAPKTRHWVTLGTLTPQFGKEFLIKTGSGANGLELRRSLWLALLTSGEICLVLLEKKT